MNPGGSVVRLLASRSVERPDHPFLWVEERGPWTLGALASHGRRLAADLRGQGVANADPVLVRLGNDAGFLPSLAAVWLAGAAAVVMHPSTPTGEMGRVIDELSIRAVMGSADDRALGEVGRDIPVVAIPEPSLEPAGPYDGPIPDVAGDDTALVLLTSGSTGNPKGVALSHGAVWANLAATVSAFRSDTRPTPIPTEPKPPNLIANPLSHTAGMVRLLFALYVGRSVVLLRKFDARAAHAAVMRHGIDHLTLNPAMLRMLLDDVDGGTLGKVRYVSSGTAPLPPALRDEFEARFGIPVLQAYGQTEALGAIAVENVRDVLSGRRRPGSVGRPLKGIQLRIVGPDGNDAGPGEQGEIQVRSPSVTSGYIGSGSEQPVDADGWLRTGDLGYLDSDGYLFVTGRLKNVIICGGFNVVPEEVEARLLDDPDVRAAAVVGLPDGRLGEIPVALVVSDQAATDISARIAGLMVPYKRPRLLFTVDGLPRLTSGKVDYPAARRLADALSADVMAADVVAKEP